MAGIVDVFINWVYTAGIVDVFINFDFIQLVL